jgi:hypothetical protein
MATPLTPDQFIAALRQYGVTVIEHPGWRTHNRNHAGAWGPVHGVMIHHTVSTGTKSSVELCYNGHSQLPGPLCHGVVAKDGTVHLVGNGRANHAGGGDPNVLQAVIDERYGDSPPDPHQHQGSAGAVDGNPHFYGFECVNLGDGEDPWPAAQVAAITKLSAALCRAHGWSEKSVIGHSEWSDWKTDPRGPGLPSMGSIRFEVKSRIAHGPDSDGEDDMPLSDTDITRLAKAVWDHGIANRFRPDLAGKPRTIPARHYLEWNDQHFDELIEAVSAVPHVDITDTEINNLADRLAKAPGLLDAIADRVADKVAARLAQ